MKQKKPLNEVIYLPEYCAGKFSLLLQKEKTSEILYWDFTKNVSEIVKLAWEKVVEAQEGLLHFVEKHFLWGTKKLIGQQIYGM